MEDYCEDDQWKSYYESFKECKEAEIEQIKNQLKGYYLQGIEFAEDAIDGETIYRGLGIMKPQDFKEWRDTLINDGRFIEDGKERGAGISWTNNRGNANPDGSFAYGQRNRIIMEGIVIDPDSVDAESIIYLNVSWEGEENEVTLKEIDDTGKPFELYLDQVCLELEDKEECWNVHKNVLI